MVKPFPHIEQDAFTRAAYECIGRKNWREILADHTGINLRSIQRMGSERNAMDARRCIMLAARILDPEIQEPERGVIDLAGWLAEQAADLIEQERRERAQERDAAS